MTRALRRVLLSYAFLLICSSFLSNSGVVLVQARVLTEIPYDFKNLCSDINAPALAGKQKAKVLTWLLQATGESSLKLKTSPQHEAACWMLFGDPFRKKVLGNRAAFRQRYALAVFYYATKGPEAWYPDVGNPNATTSAIQEDGSNFWLSKSHECTWYGVQCTMFIPFAQRKVVGLDVTFFGVGGILPRELALLNHLKELDLHGNDLQGVLPHLAVVNWKKMERLALHMNGFFGNLHSEMTSMKNLRELLLFGNYFGGTIPKQLAQLRHLGTCDFSFRSTFIVRKCGAIRALILVLCFPLLILTEVIDLYANQLDGRIPSELATLPRLRKF